MEFNLIDTSAAYIERNPRKILWRGTTAIAFAFLLGYSAGMKSQVKNTLAYLNSGLSQINRQYLDVIRKLKEIQRTQNDLSERIKNIESFSNARMSTIEYKIDFMRATKEGEEYVNKKDREKMRLKETIALELVLIKNIFQILLILYCVVFKFFL